ncbi:NYN domain-containing protein [Nocardioides acrostichi]|uniref:NYN domain-containing protein n=1 Tax=Nocardioides acrostichi TaxID=2784339 RepID=A0A930Y9N4_9ACTN|nr:NYN domain-containing protein [Nocardioides acrostichi]MBF4160553.1 NYN domain-containing protein [Nocardioides acrostichi]
MDDAPGLEDLPEPVRARVVALSAGVLPEVVSLPPGLKRIASFAPARRAKLGGGALIEALADSDLRERVAHQLHGVDPGQGDDAVGAAARAWLLRPEGWRTRLEAGAETVAEREQGLEEQRESQLRDRVATLEQQLRDVRAAHRDEIQDLRAEVTKLRRRLGESRSGEREATRAVEAASREAQRARASAEAELEAQRREVRQMRAEVERRDAEARAGRRHERAERDEATLRARLLLDTVLDATAGLRRELGLPTSETTPGERIEAEVAAASGSGGTSRAVDTPAMLEQYLALPRARLVVDGYNVTKSAWPASSLEAQRTRLLLGIAPLVVRTRAETTVVFDAADATARPPVAPPRGVRVLFSPPGVIADEVIGDLVEAEPAGRVVLVVSDDGEVRARAAAAGARPVAAAALAGLLTR